jgi:MoxR-like ATPase
MAEPIFSRRNDMPLDWFKGLPGLEVPPQPVQITSVNRDKLFGPDHYEADPELTQAVNAALLLDMPLLLTGEPGTGKTQLAEKLAAELGVDLWKFETKAASTAADLFYQFDHVRRFQAAQPGAGAGDLHPLRFIDYGPLGKAILQGRPQAEAAAWFHGGELPAWITKLAAPRRAVVLIDEIDKAPSDFPNDALNELERHYFRLRELGDRTLEADPAHRPIVVITSNSEKQLPDAFLRRCLFHHLQPISPEKLQRIATRRLASLESGLGAGRLLNDAVQLFFDLRDEPAADDRRNLPRFELRKKPSTAEFLAFIGALAETGARSGEALTAERAMAWLATLVKAPEDQDAARQHPLLGGRRLG